MHTYTSRKVIDGLSGTHSSYKTDQSKQGTSGRPSVPRRLGSRVRLTVANRPVYRGNRPYRPEPVTVPAGYQPLGLKNFEFEFQKLKIVEKSLKYFVIY
jgi:hypothetical protein